FLGNKAATAMGETSVLAVLIGFAYLAFRRIIDFKWPLILLASAAAFALLFDGLIKNTSDIGVFEVVLGHLLSGGLVFGAVFMATDYSTSPNTELGNAIYYIGIGFLVVIIRTFGTYDEGVSFAILLMNLATPFLDKYIVPKPFGYVKPRKVKAPGRAKGEQ
ncbi:MAG: RnfABCDGE type electron transport complex subunit D, partial [Firmicutes bacterium]|nr:RnfABCDGE type electron transport complex subunit D [Bacillota bacterium]